MAKLKKITFRGGTYSTEGFNYYCFVREKVKVLTLNWLIYNIINDQY